MPKINPKDIVAYAEKLGYDDVGITSARIPEQDISAYQTWLKEGKHGALHYMENQMRTDPDSLFPGAKTAIIFVTHYKQPKQPFEQGKGLIASYARGCDYHNVHRKRLKKMVRWLEEKAGEKGIAKGFSDSAPVMERALAVKAGLGWIGKNTLLIHRKFGTFTLLSGLLTTLEIEGTEAYERRSRCGTCTKCLDACPTKALSPFEIDAAKCLSYHLIESQSEVPTDVQAQNPGYAFGCDICQDVCPHNVRPPVSDSPDFSPQKGVGSYLDLSLLEEIEQFPEKLNGTPLKRRGLKGLKNNCETLLQEQNRRHSDLPSGAVKTAPRAPFADLLN